MKRSLTWILPMTILLCAAPVCQAQKNKALQGYVQKHSFREKIPHTALSHVVLSPTFTRPAYFNKKNNVNFIQTTSDEVAHARLAYLIQLQQIRQRVLAQKLANNPPVLGKKVQYPSAKLIYKGVVLDILHQGDYIIMGGAYNEQGKMVSSLQPREPHQKPIPLSQIENALPGENIERVIFAIQSAVPSTNGRPQIRLIVYCVNTGEITNSAQ